MAFQLAFANVVRTDGLNGRWFHDFIMGISIIIVETLFDIVAARLDKDV